MTRFANLQTKHLHCLKKQYTESTKMKKAITTLTISIVFVAAALAYHPNHSPFVDDGEHKRIEITRLNIYKYTEEEGKTVMTFPLPAKKQSCLTLAETDDYWAVKLLLENKVVVPATKIDHFNSILSCMGIEVYSADLNQDGITDYIIHSNSGGCGLASVFYKIAFILSGSGTYKITTIQTWGATERSYIILNEKPCFIHTELNNVDKCNDDKTHNFWVYNLLTFQKDGVVIDNSIYAGFPKTIWYTFKANHSETTIITQEQKDVIIKATQNNIFWEADSN